MADKNKYWGYIHVDGSLIVKRFFSNLDITEALESPFVKQVFSEVEADDIQAARKILIKKYNIRWNG